MHHGEIRAGVRARKTQRNLQGRGRKCWMDTRPRWSGPWDVGDVLGSEKKGAAVILKVK
jgi:hypothetical protein